MAVSSQDILNFLLANPNMSDRDIAAAMDMYGVTPAMMAQAVGIPVQQVQQRYEEVQPQGLFTAPTKAPEPVYTPKPVYTPEPTPEPVYADPTYTDPFYAEPVEPAYVAPEPAYVAPAPAYVAPEPVAQPTVTNQQIVDFIVANPTITDTQLAAVMKQYDVSPQQVAQATGTSTEEAVKRYEAVTQPVIPPEPVVPPIAPLDTPVIKPEPQQTQEATTMAVTSQQIIDFLLANPNMSDAQIVSAMETYGVSPAQMAQAVGLPEGQVVSRVAAVIPEGNAKLLGDTWVQPVYQVTGSGEDRQVGGIESVSVYKTTGGINDAAAVGTPVQNYTPTGELTGTSQITSGGGTSFFGGLVDALTDPVVLAALAGGYGAGLFGGAGLGAAGTAAGTGLGTGLTAGAGGLGLSTTGAGLGALGTGAGITAGTGLGTGVLAGSGLGTSLLGAGALTGAGVLGGTTLGTAGLGTAGGTGITAGAGGLGLSTTGAGLGATGTGAGITAGTGLGTGVLTGSGLGTTLLGTGTGALTGTGVLTGSGLGTTLLGTGAGTGVTGALTTGVGAGTLGTGALTTGVGAGLGATTGLGVGNLANLLSGGLGTAGSLLQMQQSKEAALAAQQRIDAETAAAKQSAAFRPIGMTTRFGSSQFVVDPVTGQLTSAGYTLSPEAKAAQDRFVKLAEQGIQQAEGAQKAFEPLQTGAERLFELGQGYLAKTPEQVASDYLKSQMALLQPGRELELANLQNRLTQQGRSGLSVAQGGTYGATTPELQALYNARARQEAELAANAQQLGQRDVLFGAGLLGQGAQTMGQYYGGQQASYAPFTTALGQVQGLEQLAQQPLQMGASLGQTASTAGTNVGKLGLTGAQLSTNLATSANATANPYAQALMAAGNPNAMFGQSLGNVFGGLFS